MVNEAEYKAYMIEMERGAEKASELIKCVKECQKEFGWNEFDNDTHLVQYARAKGLLSREEREVIRRYLYI